MAWTPPAFSRHLPPHTRRSRCACRAPHSQGGLPPRGLSHASHLPRVFLPPHPYFSFSKVLLTLTSSDTTSAIFVNLRHALGVFVKVAITKCHKVVVLKHREHYLPLPEATSLKSRCGWSGFLLRAVRGRSAPGPSPWLVDGHLHLHMPFSLSACLHAQMSSLYKNSSCIELKPSLINSF